MVTNNSRSNSILLIVKFPALRIQLNVSYYWKAKFFVTNSEQLLFVYLPNLSLIETLKWREEKSTDLLENCAVSCANGQNYCATNEWSVL